MALIQKLLGLRHLKSMTNIMLYQSNIGTKEQDFKIYLSFVLFKFTFLVIE